MRISDWSSDVCSSDMRAMARRHRREAAADSVDIEALPADPEAEIDDTVCNCLYRLLPTLKAEYADDIWRADILGEPRDRSEEHTSELQSLMRSPSAGFCLNTKTQKKYNNKKHT